MLLRASHTEAMIMAVQTRCTRKLATAPLRRHAFRFTPDATGEHEVR